MQFDDPIENVKLLYFKAALFVALGTLAALVILIDTPSLQTAFVLIVAIWAFCRAYYFAFYVVEHYADPGFRFGGLLDFTRYLWRKRAER